MKLTAEVIGEKLDITLVLNEKTYSETWVNNLSGLNTSGKCISCQIEELLGDVIIDYYQNNNYSEEVAEEFEDIESVLCHLPKLLEIDESAFDISGR